MDTYLMMSSPHQGIGYSGPPEQLWANFKGTAHIRIPNSEWYKTLVLCYVLIHPYGMVWNR